VREVVEEFSNRDEFIADTLVLITTAIRQVLLSKS